MNKRENFEKFDKYFGYNFLNYEMKSRDRQNSITYHEEMREVVKAWYEVLFLAEDTPLRTDGASGGHQSMIAFMEHEL